MTGFQSVCSGFLAPNLKLLTHRRTIDESLQGFKDQRLVLGNASKLSLRKGVSLRGQNKDIIASASSSDARSQFGGVEPFRGKSGSVSFCGLTHQIVEESKLISAPFKGATGSLFWVLAPVALISSLILPQFFLGSVIEALIEEETLMELVASLSFEVVFYIGVAIFLRVTDHVQRPYLQFSSKRWGLITGLRGYLWSSFLSMGLKVVAPIFAVYVTWPVLGFQGLVAVVPFLAGCAAQFAFETIAHERGSSSWPLIPIIFEVYRLYQLTRATQFIQRLMFLMKDSLKSAEMMGRGGALVAMVVMFQVLGVICLWSLLAFLLRLFPSRPVAENY